MGNEITYKDAGVDIDAGSEAVERIKKHVKETFNKGVLLGVGSFGAAVSAKKLLKYQEPVLVSSIDGVGTKIKVAKLCNKWDTVGIDLVNHSANDILCQGAEPFYFLDYIASDKISADKVEEIVKGIASACVELEMPLIGGEIAEMPGVYEKGETDLVGCITGIAEKSEIIDGSEIREGDLLVGIASDGLHTNGYSLARKVFFEIAEKGVDDFKQELGCALGEELLKPHRCYVKPVMHLIHEKKLKVKGIAHITGGGLIDNPARMLPDGLGIEIEKGAWKVPVIFNLIKELGNVPENDMYRTFNMGIGMVLAADSETAKKMLDGLENAGEKAFIIGKVVKENGVVIK